MKKSLLLIALLFTVSILSAQDLSVCTFNIRNYKSADDAKHNDNWEKRYKQLCDLINFEAPDLFGSQEVYHKQLTDMLSELPDYGYIGVGRDDGKTAGEYSPILYRKDKVQLIKSGYFWLSEQPDHPNLGWDAACVRICTWGYFKDKKSKRKFYYFNTHMDHVGVVARREGAALIMKKMKELMKSGEPVILTGDFNVDQNSEVYKVFTQSGFLFDCFPLAKYRFAENGTFNSFKPENYTISRIDHVFVSKGFNVQAYGIHTDGYWQEDAVTSDAEAKDAPRELKLKKYSLHTLSDHYPVFVKLKF